MTEISVGFTIVIPGSLDPGMHFGLEVKRLNTSPSSLEAFPSPFITFQSLFAPFDASSSPFKASPLPFNASTSILAYFCRHLMPLYHTSLFNHYLDSPVNPSQHISSPSHHHLTLLRCPLKLYRSPLQQLHYLNAF